MREAIRIAIEKGGYDPCNLGEFDTDYSSTGIYFFKIRGNHEQTRSFEEIVLDPMFWKSLVKAMGIEERTQTVHCQTWYLYAKEYLYFLLTGGDTEKFWKDLLK